MDIEEVAAKTPEKIVRVHLDPGVGMVPFRGRRLGFGIGLDGPQVNKFVKLATALCDASWPRMRRWSKSTRWW
jgi:succinyl-CoA synthetase beta subunit